MTALKAAAEDVAVEAAVVAAAAVAVVALASIAAKRGTSAVTVRLPEEAAKRRPKEVKLKRVF